MSAQISDILYPECHLDSPIVTGKLISLLIKGNFPHREDLKDPTLLRNLDANIGDIHRLQITIDQQKLRDALITKYHDLSSLSPVPYPYGNNYLFKIRDNEYTKDISTILTYANTCYKKISGKIIRLEDLVQSKLGSYNQNSNYTTNDERAKIRRLPNIMEGSKWYNPFLFWFKCKYMMRKMIKRGVKLKYNNYNTEQVFDLYDHFIAINKHLTIIVDKNTNNIYYLTFEMVLMFSDVLEGRLMIDTGMEADDRFQLFKEKGHALWNFMDSLFPNLGNETYNIVAMIEPLVLGFLQLRDESNLLRGAFLQFALGEIENEFKSHGFTSRADLDLVLDTITNIFTIDDIHMISEFFSFFRTFGHPTLEAKEAASKVREHMNKPKIVSFEIMMKGHALFCGIIINGFRDRHGGAWPPHEFPEHVSQLIKNAQTNSEALTHELCIQEWKSFVGFKFKCFMSLTLDEDLTMYMKDKALASIKKEWDSVYPREFMTYTPPKQTTSRRLVEVFLNDTEFDPINLINYVISGEYLVDEDFNLSYSLKEKEIKKVGRLFAKMTYKMRACQVVGESLIATGVGQFFKENGMVKNEHELLKTLHKLSVSSVSRDNKAGSKAELRVPGSSGQSSKVKGKLIRQQYGDQGSARSNLPRINDVQYETMSTFLTTDLQKFCLNWRQETTNIFAERLDEIYGLPGFFSWLHKRLEKSTLYVADPHCPPYNKKHISLDDTKNKQIFIKYPMGGIEGYCQKMWTIITIPILFLSAYECGAKIAAVVQGDNQAIAITKRVHPNIPYKQKKYLCSQLAQQYFDRLRMNMAGIGHNLKANETIVSSHFFIYSKRIYYDGQVLSQALKPLSRCVFWSETVVDETRSACSNICTSISKSIEQGYSRWIGYSIAMLKTIQQITIALQYTLNESMTRDIVDPLIQNPNWIIAAALIPSQLGGFNYINMSRLYVRNIGDPVTASLADVKRMIKVGMLDERILQRIMHQDKGTCTYLDWASDPYSINIPSSQSVTIMLKNITARTVLQHSQNPMLHGLFHEDFDQEDQDLAKYLLDRPIIIPRAAHEIMDKSLTGARQEIAGMLDSTKGLIRNGLRAGGLRPRLIERLSFYDYEQFRVFNCLMGVKETSPLISSDACSVELARRLRNVMWNHLSAGRPIYGLEVPDTIEAMNGFLIDNCSDCYYCQANNNEFCWFFVPNGCELDQVRQESNNIRVPYFGSTTEERSEIKLSSVRSSSRALKAAIRIATVYTWAYGDTDECWEQAWYLASFRANITLAELKAITPISTSNNIAHRLRDKSTQMKYSGSSLNRVSRYTMISNDNLNFIKDGNKIDTNLIYQQVMLLGLASLEDLFRFQLSTGTTNTVYHLHVEQNCCVIEMEDHPYVDVTEPPPVLQGVYTNRLIYDDNPLIEKDVERIYTQTYRSVTIDFPRYSMNELNTVLAQSLALTIVDIITKETKDHLTEFKVLANDDDINSLITEFMLVDPSEFALYLGLGVAVNWSFDIYYRRPQGKYQMVEYLASNMRIMSRSILSVLANALSHPKVFRRFWDVGLVEPIYGPNVNTQNYSQIAIDLITKSYEIYIDYWLNGKALEYIITETNQDIVDQRYEGIQSRHLCFVSCLYVERKYMPPILGLTSLEKCSVLQDALDTMIKVQPNSKSWNTKLLKVEIYPVSSTYLRRGSIKHIRLRKFLVFEDPLSDKPKLDPLDPKSFIIMKNTTKGINTTFKAFQASILLSDDFRKLNQLEACIPTKNRWESHTLRRVGINSTSCYKAMEIGMYIVNKVDLGGDRLFLGEGSGAMLSTYYMLLGPALCYYNTGVLNTNLIGQRVFSIYPSEVMLVAHNNTTDLDIESNIKVLFNGKPECSWVGDMECFSYIMNNCKCDTFALVHNDMESSLEKNPEIILTEQVHSLCIALNMLKKDGIYICKVAPRDDDYSQTLITLLYSYFSEVTCFIPSYSNPMSPECYLICTQKKFYSLLYPNIILDNIKEGFRTRNIIISRNILDMKFSIRKEMCKVRGLFGDYLASDLTTLDETEKALMTYGFQINGPKLIKQITGHDIGSGAPNLRGYINSSVNNLINYCDPDRQNSNFLDAYPLNRDSKLREYIDLLGKKLAVYILLYMKDSDQDLRRSLINNLRRKYIYLDICNYSFRGLIQPYLMKKLIKLDLNTNWMYQLDTPEVKIWWKIVGYSVLHQEDD
ncbi:L protein [Pohorje myodes paramyxovirus 1]|uniref:RNA-directed RNA polymerase L n=1 Tax=Pohorje myodes paramyxovirus 1 TaxID=2116604 RepID=A0A2P1GJB5_9MONO|nr:L protein [Pohorje myodes paramyxovirus 1]AVM86048.1 L protein [Pohorje myodes paramyxovirus 1]